MCSPTKKRLRLSFPTLTETTSPVQVLPNFLEVLGRKMDKTDNELDPVSNVSAALCAILFTPTPPPKLDRVSFH